jgi:hypothetical protein
MHPDYAASLACPYCPFSNFASVLTPFVLPVSHAMFIATPFHPRSYVLRYFCSRSTFHLRSHPLYYPLFYIFISCPWAVSNSSLSVHTRFTFLSWNSFSWLLRSGTSLFALHFTFTYDCRPFILVGYSYDSMASLLRILWRKYLAIS